MVVREPRCMREYCGLMSRGCERLGQRGKKIKGHDLGGQKAMTELHITFSHLKLQSQITPILNKAIFFKFYYQNIHQTVNNENEAQMPVLTTTL